MLSIFNASARSFFFSSRRRHTRCSRDWSSDVCSSDLDLDPKRQGDLLSDSRTAPVGITLLHFDYRTDEFCAGSFRAGLPTAIRGEQHAVLLLAQGFVKAKQCRRLQNDCGTEQTSGTYQECH